MVVTGHLRPQRSSQCSRRKHIQNRHNVTKIADDEYEISLAGEDVHGVLNGGVPDQWLAEIAGGLNTALQVEDMSLDDLKGAFEWIKDELKDAPYFGAIAWSENDKGEYDARDLVSLLACFHIGLYPNDQSTHPVEAYEKKSKALDSFRDDFDKQGGKEFKRLRPLLKDILALHDIIQIEFAAFHTKNGGKPRLLAIMDKLPEDGKKSFHYTFTGEQRKERLQTGALYPILAAFRWMVEAEKDGLCRWRGGVHNVLARWKETAPDLVRKTFERSKELGYNSNAIGKSRTHWDTLHQTVAFRDLMMRRQEK